MDSLLLHIDSTNTGQVLTDVMNHAHGLVLLKDKSNKPLFNLVQPLHCLPAKFWLESSCPACYVAMENNTEGYNAAVFTDEFIHNPVLSLYFVYTFNQSPSEVIDVQQEMYALHSYIIKKVLRTPTDNNTNGIPAIFDSNNRLIWQFWQSQGSKIPIEHSYFLNSIPHLGGEHEVETGFYVSRIRIQVRVNNAI